MGASPCAKARPGAWLWKTQSAGGARTPPEEGRALSLAFTPISPALYPNFQFLLLFLSTGGAQVPLQLPGFQLCPVQATPTLNFWSWSEFSSPHSSVCASPYLCTWNVFGILSLWGEWQLIKSQFLLMPGPGWRLQGQGKGGPSRSWQSTGASSQECSTKASLGEFFIFFLFSRKAVPGTFSFWICCDLPKAVPWMMP